MLCPLSGILCNLPNGELIGGYLALKGIIKEIEKYKSNKLLKKYPYLGPLPLFIVPLGKSLFEQVQNNAGKYIAFNKCSLYYENTNCHYSQGCRCYCGHCCRCCTCEHNKLNDPNLPFGAVGDKLKDFLKEFYSPLGMSKLNESSQSSPYSFDGNKGIYDCYLNDKNGYGYKFQINCEQVPFPKGNFKKTDKVSVFMESNNTPGKKNLKPFTSLFQDLLDYNPDKNAMNEPNKKRTYKRRRGTSNDEEYRPSKEELQQAQLDMEYKDTSFLNNKRKSPETPVIQNENIKGKNENVDRRVEMFVTQLTKQATKMGPVLYYLGHTGHTFAVIHYKDENEDKSIVVESNPDQNNHNRVVITPLKYFVFPEKLYKVKGVEVQIPEYISYEDILNEITMDKGEYDFLKNNCFDTVKEVLKIVHAPKKVMNKFNHNRPNVPKTVLTGIVTLPFVPIEILADLINAPKKGSNKRNKK